MFERNYFTCLRFHFLTYKHDHSNSTYIQVAENITWGKGSGAVSTQKAKGSSNYDYCKGQAFQIHTQWSFFPLCADGQGCAVFSPRSSPERPGLDLTPKVSNSEKEVLIGCRVGPFVQP